MTDASLPRALLSVSDKQGLLPLARALVKAGYGLLSTGGTADALRADGLDVTDVASHTGAAEMMGGRVKTLHPTVHGGLLGRRGVDDEVMAARGIAPIDVLVVNLYPFEATVARSGTTMAEAIENIDIGGPAMLRSAAKNHAAVTVVTDPSDYDRVIASLSGDKADNRTLRFDLAVKAFEHTARYDALIADYLGRRLDQGACVDTDAPPADFPRTFSRQFELIEPLRYGENPHQRGAFYRERDAGADTLAGSRFLQGRTLSYNNVMDADAALVCVRAFENCACVIVKHGNPCGVATAASVDDAYQAAYRTDPTSAFGGIIAFNRPLDAATARLIVERQFVEVIIAPGFDADAVAAFAAKPGVRVLECASPEASTSELASTAQGAPRAEGATVRGLQFRPVSGGLLVQDDDLRAVTADELVTVTRRAPTLAEQADLLFAWRVAKHVKSNAIVYARDGATVGVGAGQMSRVYSARIAGMKAADEGLEVGAAVMASDAFFPFRDGIDSAAEAGIVAVVQPGGSKRDDEVIAAADEHGMAMVFTGVRHFRH